MGTDIQTRSGAQPFGGMIFLRTRLQFGNDFERNYYRPVQLD
jgi:hypothetical protein